MSRIKYKFFVVNFALILMLFVFSISTTLLGNDLFNFVSGHTALLILPIIVVLLYLKITRSKIEWAWFSMDKMLALIIILLTLISLPWLLALLHIDIGEIPIMQSVFLFPNHFGFHHGYGGWFTLVSLVLLIPPLREFQNNKIKRFAIALMTIGMVIGLQNMIDDWIVEQMEPRFGIESPLAFIHPR